MLELQKSKVIGEAIHVQRMLYSVEGGSVNHAIQIKETTNLLED